MSDGNIREIMLSFSCLGDTKRSCWEDDLSVLGPMQLLSVNEVKWKKF